jgi:hypothetical protein
MDEKDFLFTEETVKFVDEHEDAKLNSDVLEAIINAAIGEKESGDTPKTMIAIAAATAVFLKMCGNKAKCKKPVTALDYSKLFIEILRLQCMKLDHPANEK